MQNKHKSFIVSDDLDGEFVIVKLRPSMLRSIANRLKSTNERCVIYKRLKKLGYILEEKAIKLEKERDKDRA